MAHREALEEEPAIEAEGVVGQLSANLADPPVHLSGGGLVAAQGGAYGLERGEQLPPRTVFVVVVEVSGEGVVPGER